MEATMQAWQIKALELEAAGFKYLDGFMHEHALGFFTGAIVSCWYCWRGC